jgi:DNA-formamidopyrimidine glycosylase
MPETVEVSIIVDKIEKKFKNSSIHNIVINSGRYMSHNYPIGYTKFIKLLPSKIISFNTKGKFIYIILENNVSIWITFGLTGELSLQPTKYSHITFETNIGNFYFNDVRNFGTIKFSFDKEELNKKLKTLGPDPLIEEITRNDFIKILRRSNLQKKVIATVLMNQKIISGIGNYLRSEILYTAKISPFRKISDLTDQDLTTIWKAMNNIIMKSYNIQRKNGLHTYPFAIYQQNITPRGEKVLSKSIDGRTVWYVPSVQK